MKKESPKFSLNTITLMQTRYPRLAKDKRRIVRKESNQFREVVTTQMKQLGIMALFPIRENKTESV